MEPFVLSVVVPFGLLVVGSVGWFDELCRLPLFWRWFVWSAVDRVVDPDAGSWAAGLIAGAASVWSAGSIAGAVVALATEGSGAVARAAPAWAAGLLAAAPAGLLAAAIAGLLAAAPAGAALMLSACCSCLGDVG